MAIFLSYGNSGITHANMNIICISSTLASFVLCSVSHLFDGEATIINYVWVVNLHDSMPSYC